MTGLSDIIAIVRWLKGEATAEDATQATAHMEANGWTRCANGWEKTIQSFTAT